MNATEPVDCATVHYKCKCGVEVEETFCRAPAPARMKPDNYIIPIASSGSTAGLMTRVLPDGETESGYLIVDDDGAVRWVSTKPDTPHTRSQD
jgi:hypothetical protein